MNYIHNTKLNPLPYIRNQTKPAKQMPLTGRKKKLTSQTKQHQNVGPQYHPKEEKKKKNTVTSRRRRTQPRKRRTTKKKKRNLLRFNFIFKFKPEAFLPIQVKCQVHLATPKEVSLLKTVAFQRMIRNYYWNNRKITTDSDC